MDGAEGSGRALLAQRRMAAAAGVSTIVVPADDDDAHARDSYRAVGGRGEAVTPFTFSIPTDT